MLAAFLRKKPGYAVRPDVAPAPPPPACRLHWYADRGVFLEDRGERLVGYIYLKRVGDIVRVTAILGGGAELATGALKLLFIETMRWLLDRADPQVQGVRYLHYGALEHGNRGLLTWKRRFLFEPFVFAGTGHHPD